MPNTRVPNRTASRSDIVFAVLSMHGAAITNQGEGLTDLKSRLAYLERFCAELAEAGPRAVEFLPSVDPRLARREEVREAVQRCAHAVGKTQEHFDDPEARLHYFVGLKKECRQLCLTVQQLGDKYALQIAQLLYDALRFFYAENLSPVQVETMGAVLKMLRGTELNQTSARTADRILVEVGLDSVPSGETC